MAKLKLVDGLKTPIRFAFGEVNVVIGQEPVEVTEEHQKAIQAQYPGWTTEPKTEAKAVVAAKV